MSVRVMADVWDFGPDDPIDNSVLLRLANHCNDQGKQCFPSIDEISKKVRRSVRTVSRSISQLESEGWITVERGSGKGNTSQYVINIALLKERQAVAFSKEKDGQAKQQRVTAKVVKGDSGDNPPHPLIGVTIINHPETPKDGGVDLQLFPKDYDSLPSWIPLEAWNGWLERRKKKKSPVEGRAKTIAINQLEKWHKQGYDLTIILDAATFHNWQGLYLPKDEHGQIIKPKEPEYEIVEISPKEWWEKGSSNGTH
jgi:DNA-binding transcriptional regulator YhcF (GntR family)